MSVVELKRAVSNLSDEDLQEFRVWFAEFNVAQWDDQIEKDSFSGHLDAAARKALEVHRSGRSTDL